MLNYTITQHQGFQLLHFDIPGGVLSPDALPGIDLPDNLDTRQGLVISGRGPIWLYAHLVHLAHVFAWVAINDPRLGAVVVMRHHPAAPDLGAVLPLDG